MSSIYDYATLVGFDYANVPGVMKIFPENTNMGVEALYFATSCWPFEERSFSKEKLPMIYSFNGKTTYFHSLIFLYNHQVYAIIMATRRPFASLLTTFLKQIKEQFMLSSIPEPNNAFTYVTSIISSWPRGAVESAVLTFPTSSLAINFDYSQFSYTQYNPKRYFLVEEAMRMWKALIIGDPILIICPTADIASKACFAAFSLISPLLFDDASILWLHESDSRYNEILSGTTQYKVVASPSEKLAKYCHQFKVVVHVPEIKKQSTDINIHEKTNKITTKVLKMILGELEMLLSIDPYSDFVERKFATDHFNMMIKEFGKGDGMTIEDYAKFENSETFKHWRRAQALRSNLRDALLSYVPSDNFTKRSQKELLQIMEGIESIKVKYWNDAHVMAVLKKHQSRVEKLIKSNKTETK
ncbi:hypothetical protein TVAG_391770 [Trichomonas vaginalis G3]|uniref:UDENN domain-containing protein n=1 Tax=Trichomonas vaginalis (strain ATCC PRA-98 / G3) TaxID=412133 RepID=A2DFU0_TRIV3|nr:UDENN domain family [Trichomonas vaginalis G3]EAY20793.1 hypothetical protein TVAG_391770 [Trichomonas vaginalis G3]KAI5529407.1 UDENN domain family [Trichomonas vaginalis G3]|eukprot:XP_001581779.1 hypothetical protein [Trichomonas vaginalis G3]